jgi:hypothetical protein
MMKMEMAGILLIVERIYKRTLGDNNAPSTFCLGVLNATRQFALPNHFQVVHWKLCDLRFALRLCVPQRG